MRPALIRNTLSLMISGLFIAGSAAPIMAQAADTAAQTQKATDNKKANKKLGSGIELQWIDKNVRPQDDFFRYTAGKWLDTAQIPADKGRTGSFDALAELALNQSRDIIQELTQRKDLKVGSNQQKIADMYSSFMDEAKIEAADIQPLQSDFALFDKLKEKSQLPLAMAHMARIGVGMPIGAGVTQDAKDSSKYAVSVGQGGLSLPDREYYLKLDDAKFKAVREAYLVHLEKMLSMGGIENPSQDAAAILALETEIAKIQWSNVENRNPVKTYNKVEVAKLSELLGNFDWNMYFAANGTGGKVDYVIVRQPSYLTGFAKLIDETPINVWQTYFKWRL